MVKIAKKRPSLYNTGSRKLSGAFLWLTVCNIELMQKCEHHASARPHLVSLKSLDNRMKSVVSNCGRCESVFRASRLTTVWTGRDGTWRCWP